MVVLAVMMLRVIIIVNTAVITMAVTIIDDDDDNYFESDYDDDEGDNSIGGDDGDKYIDGDDDDDVDDDGDNDRILHFIYQSQIPLYPCSGSTLFDYQLAVFQFSLNIVSLKRHFQIYLNLFLHFFLTNIKQYPLGLNAKSSGNL